MLLRQNSIPAQRIQGSFLCIPVLFFLLLAGPSLLNAQQTGQWKIIDTVSCQYSWDYSWLTKIRTRHVAAADRNHVVISANRFSNYMLSLRRTTDGGASWATVLEKPFGNETWIDVAHPSPDHIVIAGEGVFYTSRDGGASWDENATPDRHPARIKMLDANNGAMLVWSKSGNDLIYTTTDGWKTWSEIEMSTSGNAAFEHPAPGIFFTGSGKILNRSTDGGASWSYSALPPNINARSGLTFVDADNGWAAGGEATGVGSIYTDLIYRTTDGGTTWTEQINEVIEPGAGLLDIDFTDVDNGIAVGRARKVLRTEDGGTTWVREYPPYGVFEGFPIESFSYPSPDLAVATAGPNGPVILRSGEKNLLAPQFTAPKRNSGPKPINNLRVEWTPITGATRYRLQIADAGALSGGIGFLDTTVYQTDLFLEVEQVETGVTLNDLEYNHLYYARVKALNETQESDWGAAEALFHTIDSDIALTAPAIITPPNLSENQPLQPTVTWTDIEGAVDYDMQIALDRFFNEIVVDETHVSGTSFFVDPPLKPLTTYHVRVRARSGTSISVWTSANGPHLFKTGNQTTGVNQGTKKGATMTVRPNPATNIITVMFPGTPDRTAVLTLFDPLGREVRSIRIQGEPEVVLPVENLSPGTYVVRYISGTRTFTGSVVIIR